MFMYIYDDDESEKEVGSEVGQFKTMALDCNFGMWWRV